LLKKQIPKISNNLVLASNNAAEITNNLKKVDFSATMKKIDATLSGVKKATAQLNSKQGTLGLLLSDSTLYNNLLKTTNHMSNLLIDLKEHPKRYVHFSIFGRKNKKK
jgi:phospholipid/cholesterol/gamma-HCH transport system substrate-binding protein